MRLTAALVVLCALTGCGGSLGASGPTAIPPTPTPDPAIHGQVLFRNKGCITCHVNSRVGSVPEWDSAVGPDLSTYSNDPALLRKWLDNPAALKPGARMPDLDLSPSEIDALIAFINQPKQ